METVYSTMIPSVYHLGYYVVGQKRFINKLQAYEYALPLGHIPHWYFWEEEFDRANWLKEPDEDLAELYRQRAQDLRDRYDWITLWYSGGADSHTVAESFVKNQIPIDELVNRSAFDYVPFDDVEIGHVNNHNEGRLATIPNYNRLRELCPTLKFRHVDLFGQSVNHWKDQDVELSDTNYFNVFSPGKRFADRILGEPTRGKICRLTGVDKPDVYCVDGMFYLAFFDKPIWIHSAYSDQRTVEEFFFWHPHASKLIIKQAHLIKNWFKNNPEMLHLLEFPNHNHFKGWYQKIINRLIYPDYDYSTWQTDKPKLYHFNEKDNFWHQNNDTKAHKNYMSVLLEYGSRVQELKDQYTEKINFSQDGPILDLPGNFSKLYCLGK